MATILSITDDAPLQGALAAVLFRYGYDAHYAFNGQEGYEKLLRLRPDAVLLDAAPPALSAPELIRRVVRHPSLRNLPIIVMVGRTCERRRLEQHLPEMTIQGYLEKPVRFSELMALLREAVPRTKPARALPRPAKGGLALDPRLGAVWADGRLAATLTPRRAELLAFLLRASGAVRRESLRRRFWGGGRPMNLVEKAVSRLRAALGSEGRRLRTTPEGYELCA